MQDIPFEIVVDPEGQVQFVEGTEPIDAALHEQFAAALSAQLPLGDAWEREYRSLRAMSDPELAPLTSAADWQALEVPGFRRLVGVWQPESGVQIGKVATSADGQDWQTVTLPEPAQMMAAWQRHPLTQEPGELIGRFVVDHWQAGRIDFEPEPPAELLEILENIIEQNNGMGQSEWASRHWEHLGEPGGVPEGKRVTMDLRRPSLLRHPGQPPLLSLNGFEATLHSPAYTENGDDWIPYAEQQAEGGAEEGGFSALEALLGNIFDEQTITLTIWKNGKIEGDLSDFGEEQQMAVRQQLLDLTGAGEAGWASFTAGLLRQVYELPDEAALPVPEAVRLDFPVDALRDPENPTSYYVESEVSFDGQTWHDLYGEELPPELR